MERRCDDKSQLLLCGELFNAWVENDNTCSMEKRRDSIYNITRKHFIELIYIRYEKLKPLFGVAFFMSGVLGCAG